MGNMVDMAIRAVCGTRDAKDMDNSDLDFPDYDDGKPYAPTVKSGPIVDPEEFGGSDYDLSYDADIWKKAEKGEDVSELAKKLPPIVTPEVEASIKRFYESNPQLKQQDPKFPSVFMKTLSQDPFREGEAWIQTYSGRRFNPINPHVDAIVIQDIAHALSMQCRFSGHCKKFYSVAQHSVLVSFTCNHEDALWGLMHDASEAYLVDIPRPLKQSGKFNAYKDMETVMMRAICKRFGLPEQEPPSVKRADTTLLATEARDLMSPLRPDWRQPAEPLPFKIDAWSPQEAKNQFMKRFFHLIGSPHHYEHYLSYEDKT